MFEVDGYCSSKWAGCALNSLLLSWSPISCVSWPPISGGGDSISCGCNVLKSLLSIFSPLGWCLVKSWIVDSGLLFVVVATLVGWAASRVALSLFHSLNTHQPALTARTTAQVPPIPTPIAAPVGKPFPSLSNPTGLEFAELGLAAVFVGGATIVLTSVVSVSSTAREILK